MRKRAREIADDIYYNRIKGGTIDPVMTKLVAEELRKAVIKGFGSDFEEINYGTPDYKMLSSLEKNLFHFSAARNYQEVNVLSSLLKKEDGSLKSFKEFRDDAFKAFEAFSTAHLQTEYETAVASAQMAAKWVTFEKNKKVLPLLQYQTVGDSRVRKSHAALDGVIKRVDDPFWELYYPPNGWNCRCDVVQLVGGKETSPDQTKTPDDVPAIFKNNLAKNGQVFPPGHKYWDGVPEAIIKKAEALRNNVYSNAYTSPKTKATIDISNMADTQDFETNQQYAKVLADNGDSVKIRPHIEGVKNPEVALTNDTQIADFKTPKACKKRSIENNLIAAAEQQCDVAVLVLKKEDYNPAEIVRAFNNDLLWANTKQKDAGRLSEVWIIVEQKLIKITREEIKLRTYIGLL